MQDDAEDLCQRTTPSDFKGKADQRQTLLRAERNAVVPWTERVEMFFLHLGPESLAYGVFGTHFATEMRRLLEEAYFVTAFLTMVLGLAVLLLCSYLSVDVTSKIPRPYLESRHRASL